MIKIKQNAVLAMLALSLVACAPASEQTDRSDPLEPLNRKIFAFNETVDAIVLEPVARGYRYITPNNFRVGLRNAYRNFFEPVTMANSLLQADGERFFTSGWRFILNTTFGIGGLYDFAGQYGNLPYRREDFGQTLAVWSGETQSTYIMLPFMGPSTVRDTIGMVADGFMTPWFYLLDDEASIGLVAGQIVVDREDLLDPLDEIYETSFDPYATIRSGFKQQRKNLILNQRGKRQSDLY